MSIKPKNRSEMVDILKAALNHAAATKGEQHPLDDEQIALAATGQLDRLPAAERAWILRSIAADPESAELLSQVHDVLAESKSDLGGHRAGGPVLYTFRRATHVAWAAAACLALMLGAWRMADPPLALSPDDISFQPYQQQGPPNYWDEVDQQRQIDRHVRDQMRDYALVACGFTCVVLAIPVAWWAVQGRPRRRRE